MNCEETRKRLSEFLDGALGPGEAGPLENHLVSCPRCRAEAEALRLTLQSVSDLPEMDPPPGFSTRVMANVREIENKKRKGIWERLFIPSPIKIPAQLTALFLVGVIGIVIYQSISTLPVTMDEVTPSGPERFQDEDLSKMAEPKKKERQDGPALPESVIPEQKTNERDEAAYLSSPAAERFRAESEDETPIVQQAKKEGLLEKSDARRESAMAPSIMELVLIPHASQPDRDQLETKIAGLAMEVGGALSPDEKPGEETTRSGGPETTPAALNLTIPANQTARFKALLAGLGRIEDENRDPADSQEEIREKALKAPLGSGFSMMAAPPPPSILIIITLTPPEKP